MWEVKISFKKLDMSAVEIKEIVNIFYTGLGDTDKVDDLLDRARKTLSISDDKILCELMDQELVYIATQDLNLIIRKEG